MRRMIATTGVMLVLATLLVPGMANAAGPGKVSSLQATIDTVAWTPNASDATGIEYWASKGRFLVVDSEIEEIVCDATSGAPGANYISAGGTLTGNCTADHALTYYQGVNTWEMDSAGGVLRTSDTADCPIPQTSGTACIGYTWEPTDIAAFGNQVYVSDDNKDVIFVIDVGPDGDLNTSDDVRSSFSTRAFNDYDPEGVGYDPTTGTVLVTSGVFNQVYRVAPGPNGLFDGTDDQVSCFDAGRLGMRDPEDVAVDPATGTVYLASHATDREIAVATPQGELTDLIDTSTVLPWQTVPEIGLGGIAVGPSSDDPNRNDLFLAARGVDNNATTMPGGNDGRIFELRLDDPTTNRAPIVSTPGNQFSIEGETIRLQMVAHDANGDDLTYSIMPNNPPTTRSLLPPGLSIDESTGLISGTIAPGAATGGNAVDPVTGQPTPDTYRVHVRVTDGSLTTTRVITRWKIYPDAAAYVSDTVNNFGFPWNAPPTISSPGEQTSAEGDAVTLQVSASDPEEGTVVSVPGEDDPYTYHLMYSATGLPPGLTMNCLTGAITGTVAPGAAGTYAVRVMTEDLTTDESTRFRSKWDAARFTWNVNPSGPVNDPPVVTNPGDQQSVEGGTANLQVTANDPNGDAMTYSATGLPPGLSIDQGTGLITGTVSAGASASSPYAVTVTANDGNADGTASFGWSVLSGRPVVTAPANQTSTEGDAVNLQVEANDPNGDALTYSATGLPPGLSIDQGTGLITGTITVGPGAETPTYNVQVSASDGSLTGTSSFTWTVNAKVSFRSSSTTVLNKAARSISIARPANVAANDLLIAGITVAGTPASVTPPAGWSLVRSDTSGSMKQFVFTKIAGSEPTSYAFALPSSLQATGVIVAYSGVSTTTPVTVADGRSNSAANTIIAPAVNGTAGQMLVALFGNASNAAITQPNGMIERAEAMGAGTKKVSLEISDDHLAVTGGTGLRTATTTLAAKKGAVSVGQVLILNPA